MRKYFVPLIVAFSLFVAFGSVLKAKAGKRQAVSTPVRATPSPSPLIEIESVTLDRDEVIIPCPDVLKIEGSPCSQEMLVNVETKVQNAKNSKITYYYTVSGGQITGQGSKVIWDLRGMREGDYVMNVQISSSANFFDRTVTKTVNVRDCDCCLIPCVCPTVAVTGGGEVKAGETVAFEAHIAGAKETEISYFWSISQGEIVQGQGTSAIKVKTGNLMNGIVKATVEVKGADLCAACHPSAFETATIVK